MIEQQLARVRAHRSNIQRYRNLLQTSLTELERQFVEKRLAENRTWRAWPLRVHNELAAQPRAASVRGWLAPPLLASRLNARSLRERGEAMRQRASHELWSLSVRPAESASVGRSAHARTMTVWRCHHEQAVGDRIASRCRTRSAKMVS
jgi:hypothetical protein